MPKQKLTNVYRFLLAGVLEGEDRVFRGHKFLKGLLILCCDENRLAAVQNSFRGRLPVAEVETLDAQEGLLMYKEYCEAAGIQMDMASVHNLGKRKGQVNLNSLVEDDVDADLDAELDDLLADGEANGLNEDEVESEDDVDADSEVEDSEAEDVVEGQAPVDVDPAVARENQIRAALGQLDHDNPDHWTSTGLPKMDVLEGIMDDESLSRKEVTKVAPDFKRGN